MSWKNRVRKWLGDEKPIIIPEPLPLNIAACPNPACGWKDPITVSVLARTLYNAQGVLSGESGRLHRCPMCRWMFVVTRDGVKQCAFEADLVAQIEERRKNGPQTVSPEHRPRAYPTVPSDMQGFFAREPE